MAQTTSFSTIIRHATEHAKPAEDRQALVTIDASSGQSAPRPNIFESFTGDFRYFLVTNNRDPNGVIKGTKRVRYKEGQGEIFFAIEYAGGCRPGQEWRLAECFLKFPSLEDAFDNSLAKWFIEHFSGSLTIDDFDLETANACTALATKAGREYGLDLKVTLALEGRDRLEAVDSGTLLVFSRMQDSDDEEGMWLRVELEVDPQRIPSALINQNRKFDELLEKGVRRYVSDYVTLGAFYQEFPTEQTMQALRGHLNGLLRPFGRKAGRISLKPDDASAPPKVFKGEAVIEYRHHEYPDPIKINVSALMTLKSAARYKAKTKPKLNEWLETNLSEVIDKTLFGISYVELLLGFPELKKKIDDSMNARAHSIGYNLEQLMTILHLEPFEWLKRVDVEIKDTASDNGQASEAMFETSLSNFYVGLEIILTAKVKELRGIENYLRTKQDVPQKMKEEIVRLVRKFMHGTNPERFYMRYSRVGDGNGTGVVELSFEEELRLKIHSLLETDFNAEVMHLILKPTQTELTRKRQEVSQGSHDFTAAAELGNLPGAPTMVINGGFKVIRVSGWHAFKECDASVEAIRKRIVASIRASLKVARDDQLSFSDETGFDALVRDAVRKAGELIDEEFGLAIKLTTVYWDWEDGLKQLGRQQGKMELASVQERIMRLKELLLDLLESDASPSDIKDVKERISRLSATLKPALASSAGIQQLPEPQTPKGLQSPELEQTDS
jgi:hypothetical protein